LHDARHHAISCFHYAIDAAIFSLFDSFIAAADARDCRYLLPLMIDAALPRLSRCASASDAVLRATRCALMRARYAYGAQRARRCSAAMRGAPLITPPMALSAAIARREERCCFWLPASRSAAAIACADHAAERLPPFSPAAMPHAAFRARCADCRFALRDVARKCRAEARERQMPPLLSRHFARCHDFD
jgi:hypothetical protein